MDGRIRALERQSGRKIMEVEILKEALAKAPKKTEVARLVAAEGRVPLSVMAKATGVSRSQLSARLAGPAKPRRR